MKVKDNFNLEKLLDYGFEKVNKQKALEDEDYTLSVFDYSFNMGHSRRGQFYYLLINEKTRVLNIYASEPDGSGGLIVAHNVLVKMSLDGIFV